MLLQATFTLLAAFAGHVMAVPAKEDMVARTTMVPPPEPPTAATSGNSADDGGFAQLFAGEYVSLQAVESVGVQGGGWGGDGSTWNFPFNGSFSQAPFTAFFMAPGPLTTSNGAIFAPPTTPTSSVMCTLGATGSLDPTIVYPFDIVTSTPHAQPTANGPVTLSCAD